MQRVAFELSIRPDRVADYRRTHSAVWPELRDEIRRAGIRNYSIYLLDHHAIGYLECEDWEATSAYLAASDTQARWQAAHADILDVDTSSGLVPLTLLDEVFHQD